MTEPSQYFKGRTVQEQMNEVIGYVDTRAAEVATTAIANDVAQVHQDMLDADADAQAAAASAAAAAGTLANAVKKTGEASQSIAGDIAVAGDLSAGGDLAVTGDAGVQGQLSVLGGCDLRAPVTVPTPSNNTDATTKKYVDDADALKLNITNVNSYAVGMTGNQANILGNKGFNGNVDFHAITSYSTDDFVNPIVKSIYNTTDADGTILEERQVTKESANMIRFDTRNRMSKDGTSGNRIDAYFRTTINESTETLTLQLFILVYENGVQVRSKSMTLATLTAV